MKYVFFHFNPSGGAQASQVATSVGSATLTFTDSAFSDGGTYYYYAVITQTDGDKMWTAPIRYTRSDAQLTPPPVKLLRFQATLQNEDEAVLRWATASEQGSAYFAVERSLDGQHFAEAGWEPRVPLPRPTPTSCATRAGSRA